jgi:membrane-associated phospholipid phosphatase
MAAITTDELMSTANPAPWSRQRWGTLLVGFALAFGVGVVFALTTRSSGGAHWSHGLPWERALLIRIHTPLPRAIDQLMLVFPWFGTNISLIPAVALICWWLWAKRDRPHLAMRLLVVQLGSYLLNPSLKAMFDRPRPDLFERRGWYGWSSYPSGHAVTAAVLYVTLALVGSRHFKGPAYRHMLVALSVAVTLLVAASRVYLGVHYPSDITSGTALGAGWAVLLTSVFAYDSERTARLKAAAADHVTELPPV